MPRITPADLRLRYGSEIDQLADRDRDGAPDTGVIEAAITDAEATVDSYVRAAPGVTPDTPDPALDLAVARLARASLWPQPPEHVQKEAEATRSWLRDLAAGRAALDQGTETATPGLTTAGRRARTPLDFRGWPQ